MDNRNLTIKQKKEIIIKIVKLLVNEDKQRKK